MDSEVQSLCIKYIADEWRKLRPLTSREEPPLLPPWAVWIRYYDPISSRMDFINDKVNVLRKVWLLSSQGVQERDPWEYARFIVVNWYCPWAIGNRLPPRAIWGYYHQIAVAAFAQFGDSDTI